jgi:hypothetical protein
VALMYLESSEDCSIFILLTALSDPATKYR